MDTSKEYIEMCEKAEEIQGNHKIVSGDYFNDGEICAEVLEVENNEGYLIKSIYGKYFLPSECVWLPRQDQLQEMINQDYLTGFIYDLYEFSKEWLYHDNGNDLRFTSLEQLWLAFVMYEKFNKVWDGKEWIKRSKKAESED